MLKMVSEVEVLLREEFYCLMTWQDEEDFEKDSQIHNLSDYVQVKPLFDQKSKVVERGHGLGRKHDKLCCLWARKSSL